MGRTSLIIVMILALAGLGYVVARARVLAKAGGDRRKLHSLPSYYGAHAAMLTGVPAMGVLAIWLIAQPMLINNAVSGSITQDATAAGSSVALMMGDVQRVADGLDLAVARGALSVKRAQDITAQDLPETLSNLGVVLGGELSPQVLAAAQSYRSKSARGQMWMAGLTLAIALAGFILAIGMSSPQFRARNAVERGIMCVLVVAASLAILTTVGIVLSMLFEARNFFQLHDWRDFFFGTTWAPNFRGDSALSILPLLWGTLYISVIALAVAVPVGLFAAIYLSEYASARTRAIAKPLIEILAGIPTIVYGLFALLTVGPMLVNIFGRGQGGVLGVEWMSGATAVLTAGLVMGIMLIPFVSSLSDDIINAVPQSLRDGSYGLGATQSETIRHVVLPAALPGIVGAILLAASRAIGETMIVVLGAGAIAKFSLNPLEAMTTITTRIVSQLTGDTDFASPETLVAFALGLTLFVLTLGLNVIALYIVRTYREQYD